MKWYSYLPFLDEHTYERYLPTAFDESMTLLQKVNKVIEGLNTVIRAMNKTFEEVDKQNDKITAIRDDFETLKEWLENEGLQERTVWVLNEWFDSGKLTQIINNDVFDMKTDKTTFEDFVLSITTELQQTEQNLTTQLQQTEQELTTQLQQTEQELTTQLQQHEDYIRIKRDKTIFIGDSYGNFPTPESSWIPNTAKLLGIPNGKWYSESEGGAGFTGADGSLYTFKQLLERLENTITDKANVGQIIVCGGFNDRGQAGTVTRITTKIEEFMTYVKATYPNAEVYIGMIGWSKLSGHTNQLTAVLPAYTHAGNYGANYLHNVQYVMHNHNLYYDDVHPNLEGSYRLAYAIASAIKTGSASVNYETKQFARGYTGALGVAATTGNFFGTLNNNISTLRIQRGFIAITATDIDLTGGTFYKILSINNGYFTGTDTATVEGVNFNNNVFGVGTTCKIGKTETDGSDVYAVFYVYDGYLCAKFYRPTGGVSEGVVRIDIPDLIITGDTMTA